MNKNSSVILNRISMTSKLIYINRSSVFYRDNTGIGEEMSGTTGLKILCSEKWQFYLGLSGYFRRDSWVSL
jgi:hypothetical protein